MKIIKKIELNTMALAAFEQIKKELTEETQRTQPDFTENFILTTDASDTAIGGILSQKDNEGKERMVAAFSRTMDQTQRNYSVTDKELLVVIKATEHFRRYLNGKILYYERIIGRFIHAKYKKYLRKIIALEL